uniref:Succinate:cytochrome c oxidoreductase subunit 3 n=1 Tax=Pterocladiella musciformis TaxID=2699131 RepID=A0A1D8X7Z9_9FLOR|nr:succinate:cytochrome c oxidoreductase subunit 3 [Pterocladiella musciformis]AOX49085.1 succinate:cytochrome c oxidoreductase subunit 3 [Pterocladiella musciformis]
MLRDFLFSNRPVSPHLTIYVPQQSSIFSIWHRISGLINLFLIFILVIFVNNLLLCGIQNFWFKILIILNFSIIKFIWLLILITLFYHTINGLRHILWNLGILLNKESLFYFTILTVLLFLLGIIIL